MVNNIEENPVDMYKTNNHRFTLPKIEYYEKNLKC